MGEHILPRAHPVHCGVVVASVPARAADGAVCLAAESHCHVYQPGEFLFIKPKNFELSGRAY